MINAFLSLAARIAGVLFLHVDTAAVLLQLRQADR